MLGKNNVIFTKSCFIIILFSTAALIAAFAFEYIGGLNHVLFVSENSAWFGNCPLHGDTRVQVVTSVRSADFYHLALTSLVVPALLCFMLAWNSNFGLALKAVAATLRQQALKHFD